jgi:hypothetical protein
MMQSTLMHIQRPHGDSVRMLPKIPEYKKRGRSGEYEIASLLCTISNVMVPDYDVGFDFYCELLEGNSPSGKFFWVQAKTTQHIDNIWREYIDKKTIFLWLQQFSPVFVFVFEQTAEKCYWLSVEKHRAEWTNKIDDSNDSIEVLVDRKHVFERNGGNAEFIKQVRRDFILTSAVHGIPHMIGDGYVRSIPVLRLSELAISNVRHKIRLGLDYLIGDLLIKNNVQGAYELLRLLADFDRGHYDHFLILARVCRQLGKMSEARDNYNVAIGICKDDPNWNKRKKPEDATIEEVIESLEKELSELKIKRV